MNANRIPFDSIELGDMLTLPDGSLRMVRSKVQLPSPAAAMSGFILCGEFESLLALPALPGANVDLYVPVKQIPRVALTTHSEGVANYWAPHLPSVQGAMAEILWRVALTNSSPDPVTIVWRGPEPVIFAKAASFSQKDLGMLWARRVDHNQFSVEREAGLVGTPVSVPERPVVTPQETEVPTHVPVS